MPLRSSLSYRSSDSYGGGKGQKPVSNNTRIRGSSSKSYGIHGTKKSPKYTQPYTPYTPKKGGTGGSKPTPTKLRQNSGITKVSNVAPPVPGPVKPIIPDINAYLAGDVDYQNQLRQFDKTLADYTADSSLRKTRTEADYGEGKRNMEKQRIEDLAAIKDDFASRGILGSGLYTGRVGEYETGYGTQLADLERQFNQSIQDLSNQNLQFNREQELAKEAARQDAIRRRAQQYGL